MKTMTRRDGLKWIALAAAATAAVPVGFGPVAVWADPVAQQPGPTEVEAAAIERIVREVMQQHAAPAISLAVARQGQFVYHQAFGFADPATKEPVTTASLFRIASISKPVTSVAIFSLIEQGRLGLDDLVFGAQGILKFDYGAQYPTPVEKITVHHLLTHTGGGWGNSGPAMDPMFCNPTMSQRELIRWAVRQQPLAHEPGTFYDYSNFGYCLLGRVIEKVTGQAYADYVQQAVLAKCGISDMRLGGNTLAQRVPGEVVYHGQAGSGTDPYNMNITRMDAHGGWIATPTDLVRFAMHVDGFTTTPNILKADTIKTMTTASVANPHYACGWAVNSVPNWWHAGSLPGTLTNMVRTNSGLCWAAFTNTRTEGLDLDAMMWRVVKAVPGWRA